MSVNAPCGPRFIMCHMAYYGREWKRLRAEVLDEYPMCQVRLSGCQGWATEVDHIVPRARGGSDERGNLRASCRHCNRSLSGREFGWGRYTSTESDEGTGMDQWWVNG